LYESQATARSFHLQQLRDEMQDSLKSQCPGVIVNGGNARRVPHTLNLSFAGVNRQAFLMAADMAGLAISTGSACASGSSEPSTVLLAMGADQDVVEGSIRISLGATSTARDIRLAVERIVKIVNDLRGCR
jgi:cysteine desulfurase